LSFRVFQGTKPRRASASREKGSEAEISRKKDGNDPRDVV